LQKYKKSDVALLSYNPDQIAFSTVLTMIN